jgi:hypothetical protein
MSEETPAHLDRHSDEFCPTAAQGCDSAKDGWGQLAINKNGTETIMVSSAVIAWRHHVAFTAISLY